MSAIATKIAEKYNLHPQMSGSKLSQYTAELLKDLTDDRKRNQARRRLRDGFKFSDEQVSILIPTQKCGRQKEINLITLSEASHSKAGHLIHKATYVVPILKSEEIIKELGTCILRDNLSIKDVRAEARILVELAPNASASSSCLSRLRREL